MSSSKSRNQVWDEWQDLVKMTQSEVEPRLDTADSRSGGNAEEGESSGDKSGRRIALIKDTEKDGLSQKQRDHMPKVLCYVKPHLSQCVPDIAFERFEWPYPLMTRNHDLVKETSA